jgi:phytoene synthase
MIGKFSSCENSVKKHDYERYLCCLLTNKSVRHKLFAIYAFNNEIAKIKDITSEPMAGYIRLQWWRDAIEEIYNRSPVKHRHEVVEALYEVVSQSDIPKEWFYNLIDAREADIEFKTPENIDDLKKYAIGTSSNLFYLLMVANNINFAKAKEAAYFGGISYALIGLMRSMKYNAYHGRVMFPSDLMQKEGISSEDLSKGISIDKTKAITIALCTEAEVNLQNMRALIGGVSKEAKSILLPVCIVDVFLKRIRKNDYNLFKSDIEGNILSLQLRIYMSNLVGQ